MIGIVLATIVLYWLAAGGWYSHYRNVGFSEVAAILLSTFWMPALVASLGYKFAEAKLYEKPIFHALDEKCSTD